MKSKKTPFLKYDLYRAAVQDPPFDVPLYYGFYKTLNEHLALKQKGTFVIREDFCGSYAFSAEWVKQFDSHRAIGIDFSQETLAYGKKPYESKLTKDQKKRLQVIHASVLDKLDHEPCDLITANNFSFFCLKKWEDLLTYFIMARQKLKPSNQTYAGGYLVVEVAGGSEFLIRSKEKKVRYSEKHGKFYYFWDQQKFDPITHEGKYAIHFQLPAKGAKSAIDLKNAFEYDWRLWSIPEVRLAMKLAGFKKTLVLWQKTVRGEETGVYQVQEHTKNDVFWIAYVVGIK